MQGFLVLDYLPHAEKAFRRNWDLGYGRKTHIEDVQEGLENCPKL